MVRTMKRIVSFFVLLASFVLILMQPAVETPVAASHPIPVWSILGYLAVVAVTAGVVAWTKREHREAQPEMA